MGFFDRFKPAASTSQKPHSPDPKAEIENALRLAARRDVGAVDALITLIARFSQSGEIGFASPRVAHALGDSGDPRAVAPLIGLLESPDLRAATKGIILTEGMARIAFDRKQADGSLHGLTGSDLAIRFYMASGRKEALYALGRLRDPRAVPILQQWIAGEEPEYPADERRVAAASLGWIGDATARAALVDAARRDDSYVGRAANGAVQLIDAKGAGTAARVCIGAASEEPGGGRRVQHLMVIRCGSRDVNDAQSLAPKAVDILRERGYSFDNSSLKSSVFSEPFERMWFDLPVIYGHLRIAWPVLPPSGLKSRVADLWLRDADADEFCGYACLVLADAA